MSATARSAGSAGCFATARRGGLTCEEIRQIEALRSKDRPEPWQALAARFGRPVEDIKAVCTAPRPVVEIARHLPPPEPVAPPQPVNTPAALLPGLWIAGLSVDQISNILGIDDRSVRRLREKLGLPPRYRGGDQ
jgi:hypothetical protein